MALHRKSLVLLILVLMAASLAAENGKLSYYASNSIGMKLDPITADTFSAAAGWVIASTQMENGYVDSIRYGGIEQWRDTVSISGTRRELSRSYPDGVVRVYTYFDNLLITEELITVDESGTPERQRTVNLFDAGVLTGQEFYRNGMLQATVQYVRNSDGALHLRRTLYADPGAGAELLILGSARGSDKTVIGIHDDFSVMQTLPNGETVTERWVAGAAVTPTNAITTDPEGQVSLRETAPDGSQLVSLFDSSGLLVEKRSSGTAIETTERFFYDDQQRLIREERVTGAARATILYSYDGDTLDQTTEYENGMITKIISYETDGMIETLYKRGKPHVIVYYEADGITVKETELVE